MVTNACIYLYVVNFLEQRCKKFFCSLRSGNCSLIPENIRKMMSERIRSLPAYCLPKVTLFDPCIEHVFNYLRKQHASWINSERFKQVLQKTFLWILVH